MPLLRIQTRNLVSGGYGPEAELPQLLQTDMRGSLFERTRATVWNLNVPSRLKCKDLVPRVVHIWWWESPQRVATNGRSLDHGAMTLKEFLGTWSPLLPPFCFLILDG